MMNDILNYNRDESDDYYKLLGCTIHSTDEQIQKEFKIRALELHPDKILCDPNKSDQKELCEKFQKLKKAKEILLDKEKRMLYDKWLLGGIMMSFEQFTNYTKQNCQSFHWACKKPDPMITCYNENSINKKANLEKHNSKLNLKDTPVFKTNDFIWPRNELNDSNDLLKKFRNYEI